MKRLLILLSIILLTTTTSFSKHILNTTRNDSTVVITDTELREVNLIFAEHSKLLTENSILKKQLNNYQLDNKLLVHLDSIKTVQINTITDKNKKLQQTNKFWKFGGITCSSILFILLLLK